MSMLEENVEAIVRRVLEKELNARVVEALGNIELRASLRDAPSTPSLWANWTPQIKPATARADVTAKQAAKELGCTARTVRVLLKKGTLKSGVPVPSTSVHGARWIKTVDRAALDAFIKKAEV